VAAACMTAQDVTPELKPVPVRRRSMPSGELRLMDGCDVTIHETVLSVRRFRRAMYVALTMNYNIQENHLVFVKIRPVFLIHQKLVDYN
jgi:hypothetical protein